MAKKRYCPWCGNWDSFCLMCSGQWYGVTLEQVEDASEAEAQPIPEDDEAEKG